MKKFIVFFPTNDLIETERFYIDVMEFTIYQRTKKSIIFDTGYGCLGFVNYGDNRPLAIGNCISFDCKSAEVVNRMYNKLLNEKHCDIKSGPKKYSDFPVYSFFFCDNNGYLLEYQYIYR